MDSSGMDLAVVSGPVERQTPFYKGVRGVEVSTDITRRCFTTVLVADVEWDECQALVMFEASGYGGSGSARSSTLRLLWVSGASMLRF
jgi:hypothetical protein